MSNFPPSAILFPETPAVFSDGFAPLRLFACFPSRKTAFRKNSHHDFPEKGDTGPLMVHFRYEKFLLWKKLLRVDVDFGHDRVSDDLRADGAGGGVRRPHHQSLIAHPSLVPSWDPRASAHVI